MGGLIQDGPVSVAARSKVSICGRSPAEIVGLNPTAVIDICRKCCVLRWAGHSPRGVLLVCCEHGYLRFSRRYC